MNFSPKILGPGVGIFRNFWHYFRDYFQTVQAKFSRLISDNPDMIFGTVFR